MDMAEAQEALLLVAMSELGAEGVVRVAHNNSYHAIMGVGVKLLRGEILYRKGEHDAAFTTLREAAALEDALLYDEPWGWMTPVRHALGGLLLEQGRADEAAVVFRADMSGVDAEGKKPRPNRHPRNVWSLQGLMDCLAAGAAEAEEGEINRVGAALIAARAAAGALSLRKSCGCCAE